MLRPFAGSFAAALLPAMLGAQLACPSGASAPYFGWKSTECGNCAVYGAYLEYMTPPKVRDIVAGDPADGRLHENDVLLGVDGQAITTPSAWHLLRDARLGQPVRFRVGRGRDTVETTIVTAEHCVPVTVAEQAAVEGRPDSVAYDPASGRLYVATQGVVVRARPREP
jgi:PDZ domain